MVSRFSLFGASLLEIGWTRSHKSKVSFTRVWPTLFFAVMFHGEALTVVRGVSPSLLIGSIVGLKMTTPAT